MDEGERQSAEFLLPDGALVLGAVEMNETEDGVSLAAEIPGVGEYSIDGPDAFEALCELRRRLEPLGVLVRCAGACRNVFPSPMARSMGAGRSAYRLVLGRPARTEDLVDIFTPMYDGCDLATVAEQAAFYEEWLTSLARQSHGPA